jgi:hypothetical protein
MKDLRKTLVTSLGFMTLALSLWACGGSDNGTTSTAANSCAAGTVYTASGCLSQGSCPTGYGSLNGQCIVATTAATTTGVCTAGQLSTQYGCLAQTSQCQANYAFYTGTNSCVPGTVSTGTTGYPYGQAMPYGQQTPYGTQYPGMQTGIQTGMMYGQPQGGMVYTVYGMLPQGPCVPGYGFNQYDGRCYSAVH